jgi:membrane-associated phospholipid phosphatase
VFTLFSCSAERGFLKQPDFDTTVRIQAHIPARFDAMWETIALPVTPTPSLIIVGLITLIAFFNKRIRFRAFLIPILFGLLVMGELYGKSVVHHPAPPFFMIKNPTTIFPQFYINEQFSYPSGHTARAVFLGLVFYSLFVKKKLKLLAALGVFTYIIVVATGRIYLGHHWLSDIIGGHY